MQDPVMSIRDTIAAIATPPGLGGIGIVRVSGSSAPEIAKILTGRLPPPRFATFSRIYGPNNDVLDEGISLFFPGPHSFTGDDVLELQCHGGTIILDSILTHTLSLGARLARPGEFSERAFLNGKLDLAQAEAIADLIESASETAARLASRTLQGEFSRHVHALVDQILNLRTYVEAAVDFPDEDINFFAHSKILAELHDIEITLNKVRNSARQGQLLRDGMTLVIAGLPNAGKSSLLNALAGYEAAIVTHIPGTTRDVLRERILIDGMPLYIVDTAGLRDVQDIIEQEGIRRARHEIEQADRVLWIIDDSEEPDHNELGRPVTPTSVPITWVRNKIDLTGTEPGTRTTDYGIEVAISASTGIGVDALRNHLKACVGYQGPQEGEFMARRRHISALERAAQHVTCGTKSITTSAALELLAEELRLAQNALAEITGEVLSDDLLGEIFGRFCIGK